MSLLEDVFLQDEADEAQELERVIEGDEYDERPRSVASNSDDNSEKEDEAAEDKRRVDPNTAKTKRVVKNPRVILNPARLTGPRGIQVIPEHFKEFKFKGKGHEKEDLDLVLKKLEHWAYRLYPKFQFEDCLKKIETLGKKRPVMVHLHKIRSDQYLSEETVVQKDSSDEEVPQEEDEFDKLLQQQIDLARSTPAPGSVKKPEFFEKRSPLTMPKATSSPSINDEQRDRMIRNRQLAEQRRIAKLNHNITSNTLPTVDLTNVNSNTMKNATSATRKHNQMNSSDDEVESTTVNQETTIDVHNNIIRKNIIDLTDTEATNNSNEIPTVDLVESRKTSVDRVTKHIRSNIIDSSDDENLDAGMIHDRIDIDTGNTRKNRSNVIDSSDDESELTAFSEAVAVDVHDYHGENNTDSREKESRQEGSPDKTLTDLFCAGEKLSSGDMVDTELDKGNIEENSVNQTEVISTINNLQHTVNMNTDDNIESILENDKDVKQHEKRNNTNVLKTSIIEDKPTEGIEKINSNEKSNDISEEKLDSVDEENKNIDIENKNFENGKLIYENAKEVIKNTSVIDSSKEHVDSVTEFVEDLMDVDFSDDF